jgi:hypothetical protein
LQAREVGVGRPDARRRSRFKMAAATAARGPKYARPSISNAKYEQADQARPHRWQPRLISRYVGARKPIRRRATCLTTQRSASASSFCAWLARA